MSDATCDIEAVFKRNIDAVYRLCYSYLGSAAEAEDAAQTVFFKLVDAPRSFNGPDHERAWLLRVAANTCKDVLKSARVAKAGAMPADVADARAEQPCDEVMEAVLALPEAYKDCVYLHYCEGYKTDEIAQMTGAKPSTVRNRLADARAMLRKALSGNE